MCVGTIQPHQCDAGFLMNFDNRHDCTSWINFGTNLSNRQSWEQPRHCQRESPRITPARKRIKEKRVGRHCPPRGNKECQRLSRNGPH